MKYFEVSFCYAPGIYCVNLARATNPLEVAKHYSGYTWVNIKEVAPEALAGTLRTADRKGMPIITI